MCDKLGENVQEGDALRAAAVMTELEGECSRVQKASGLQLSI